MTIDTRKPSTGGAHSAPPSARPVLVVTVAAVVGSIFSALYICLLSDSKILCAATESAQNIARVGAFFVLAVLAAHPGEAVLA